MSIAEKLDKSDEIGKRLYVGARFLEKNQVLRANRLMVNAARTGNPFAIMRFARFSIDEIREIYK